MVGNAGAGRPARRPSPRHRDDDGGVPTGRRAGGGVPATAGAAVCGGGVEGEMRLAGVPLVLLVVVSAAAIPVLFSTPFGAVFAVFFFSFFEYFFSV